LNAERELRADELLDKIFEISATAESALGSASKAKVLAGFSENSEPEIKN
jgi:hypothetical protein